jgi:parallel beta-helix repeat protein
MATFLHTLYVFDISDGCAKTRHPRKVLNRHSVAGPAGSGLSIALIVNITTINKSFLGIAIGAGSGNTLISNTANGNNTGILLDGSTNNTVRANETNGNSVGIAVFFGSTGNLLQANRLTTTALTWLTETSPVRTPGRATTSKLPAARALVVSTKARCWRGLRKVHEISPRGHVGQKARSSSQLLKNNRNRQWEISPSTGFGS